MENNQQNNQPRFLVTIDTEGDDLWSAPKDITTHNAEYLPRFQSLCESYGLKPTYLTSYEMAISPFFQEFGREVINNNAAEIGMHLHAWNTPPLSPITEDDYAYRTYLIEYPEQVMRDKVRTMTDLLEDVFNVKMISHRAGRLSFNEVYARILVEEGYCVDCSVTPHLSWKQTRGAPHCEGGTDFSRFPEHCYLVDLNDISLPGDSTLLEVPMTVIQIARPLIDIIRNMFPTTSVPYKALNRIFPSCLWLYPGEIKMENLQYILNECLRQNHNYVELCLHSSELMPGGSPRFKDEKDIEVLYDYLEKLFAMSQDLFQGSTLKLFHQYWLSKGEYDATSSINNKAS